MNRFALLPGCVLGLLCLIVPVSTLYGQETKEDLPKSGSLVSTASFAGANGLRGGNTSEAATQNRLGDIPVNLYTGSPLINFPIYTLQEGALVVPVSLGYASSGLRPGETASWCGLGWTLQAGGMVTRQVRGVPDEGIPVANGGWLQGYYDVGWSNPSLEYDHEPDVFIANCNGQTVRFMLDGNKVFRAIPEADIRIEAQFKPNRYQSQVRTIKGFKLTFPDGSRYVFGAYGQSDAAADDFDYAISKEIKAGLPDNEDYRSRTPSTWHLRRLESAQGQSVTFNYRKTFYGYPQLREQETTGIGTPPETVKVDKVYVSASVLYSIEGLNTTIYINKDVVNVNTCNDPVTGELYDCVNAEYPGDVFRDDLLSWYNNNRAFGKILKRIVVEDRHDNNRKLTYSFDYGYFSTNAENPHNTLPTGYTGADLGNTHYKRLRLNQFTMPDGTTCSFTYNNENDLPSCVIRSIDHWGYYNGAGGGGGNHLIGTGECQATASWMADRSVRNTYAQYGQLRTITLSSGLETTLTYEGHQAYNYGEVGGLRIKRIAIKDQISQYVTLKEYEYGDPANGWRQSGFLPLRPVYRFDRGNQGNPTNTAYLNSYLYQAALTKSGKPVVGYSYVKESTFIGVNLNPDTFDRNWHRVGLSTSQFDQSESEYSACEFGSTPWRYQTFFDLRAGNLKKQTMYNRSEQKVAETEMEYNETYPSTNPRFVWDKILSYNGMTGREAGTFNQYLPKFRVSRQISRQYDQDGNNPIESQVEFTYKDQMDQTYRNTFPGVHNQVVKTKTWDSKGQATETINRYVGDYEFGTVPIYCTDPVDNYQYVCDYQPHMPGSWNEARAIYNMQEKNMIAAPIETTVYRNNKCLSASYSQYVPGSGLLGSLYTLDRFPLTDFAPAYYQGQNNGDNIRRDDRYKQRTEYQEYNAVGMPVQVRNRNGNGATTRTDYSYNGLLPGSMTEDWGGLSMTTSYTYYPLWGVATQRLPNNTGFNYGYDGVGRRIEDRTQNGYILKRVEYKRKDQ